MIALISPAKTLDFSPVTISEEFSTPEFTHEIHTLIQELQTYSTEDIAKLMKLSDKLSELNYQRFQEFSATFSDENSRPALFAFKGDVYTGLEIESFDASDIDFAKNSVRMLSGLYGLLKPLDLIQPYRLEMGTTLAIQNNNQHHKNLYEFWGKKISEKLNEIEDNYIINLASNEYFKAVDTKTLQPQIIDINFKENKGGVYKIIGIYAKRARGKMVRFMIKNKITNPQGLKAFNLDNYQFNDELSSEYNWVFTR